MVTANPMTRSLGVRSIHAASTPATATAIAAPSRRVPDAMAATYATVTPARKSACAFQAPMIGLMTRAHGSQAAAETAAKRAPRANVLHLMTAALLRPCGVA